MDCSPRLRAGLVFLAAVYWARPVEAQSAPRVENPCFHNVWNVSGSCKPLPSCQSALEELKAHMYPQTCGFSGTSLVPNVCCPLNDPGERIGAPGSGSAEQSTMSCVQWLQSQAAQSNNHVKPPSRRPGSIAKRKCREYVDHVCSETPSAALMLSATEVSDKCHYRVELISGGKEVDPMEFPHMALLGYGPPGRVEYSCGGALISPQFIVTAAHCRHSRSSRDPVRWALMGVLNRTQDHHHNAMPQLKEIPKGGVILHPDYRGHLRYNDIALLKLATPVEITEFVRPACLHTDMDGDVTGVNAIATGWGNTGDGEDSSDRLLKVNLPISTMDHCRKVMKRPSDPKLTHGILETQLCAGGGSIRDTCPGDSGGPLQVPTNSDPYCMYRIVGVVSFGPPCGIGFPGVYTRVSAFVPWIESVVWPEGS